MEFVLVLILFFGLLWSLMARMTASPAPMIGGFVSNDAVGEPQEGVDH